ncbi:hypothetical protein GGP41_004399 [Bipolaris sorokiniana]|uniref:DUF4360 domain-containing protein n=2 Tax=Cochliobolus sativus TaxID=45130 RepID=A0A8H5ZJ66_COCSA|nr:uncharacterized protein COCSADRAFT_151913 [Bipolaris sorokiniana ND90Pr]EMD59563.1 hypothetical protein COCSADRAFT_151913 [Bipolaris sorokiniana ND90Pr]KAF5851543.1 hypothetical protein GGP41_004399 [Bipolaris sorokiniana]
MKCTLATLVLAAVAAAAPTYQAPDSFKIKSVVSGGSGCPQGSIDIDWTEQGILPIYFNKQFTARVGSGKGPEESRKNCQINLGLEFSPGFSFAVFRADYSGWGELDTGVTGVVKSTYYFSGEQDQTSSALVINGPFNGKYYKQDNVPAAVWSPCGKDAMFNINSEVALTPFATPANGVLAATKESGRFTSNLYFQWKKC